MAASNTLATLLSTLVDKAPFAAVLMFLIYFLHVSANQALEDKNAETLALTQIISECVKSPGGRTGN